MQVHFNLERKWLLGLFLIGLNIMVRSTFNLEIEVKSFLLGKKMCEEQLRRLRMINGLCLRIDHTYQIVKQFGAFDKKSGKWVILLVQYFKFTN